MRGKFSLSKQAIILMTGQGSGFLIAFFIPIVIVRLTSIQEYGTYKQFFLIFSTVFPLAQFGMVQSIYYFIPDNKKRTVYVMQAFLFLIFMGLTGMLGLSLFKSNIAQLLNNSELINYIPILGLFLFFMLGASFLEGLLIAESKIVYASISFFLTEVFKASFMIIPIFLAKNLHMLFLGVVCFGFIRFLATGFYIWKCFFAGIKKINRDDLKKQFSYMLPLGIATIFFTISINLQNYFVSYYFTTEIYAIFAVGLFYPPILEVIESPIIEPMFVEIVRLVRGGDREAILQIWHNSIRKISLAIFPILAFSFVEATQIISILFTTKFLESVPIFMIAIFRIAFIVFIPDNVIKAYGKTRYILRVNIITLVINAVILTVFINLFGIIGAAIAMVVNEVILKVLLINKARSILDLSLLSCLPWSHLGQGILVSCISIVPVYVYNGFFRTPSIVDIIIALIIFFLFYFVLLFKSSLLTQEEKKMFFSFISEKKMKLKCFR